MIDSEWTTVKEPRPRITRYKWEVPGRILIASHGFTGREHLGARWWDTQQRMELDPGTGLIMSTYTYIDRRPPLSSVLEAMDDGTLLETFTTADGVQSRNRYQISGSVHAIVRERQQNGAWVSAGTSIKAGISYAELERQKLAVQRQQELAAAAAEADRLEREARYAAEEAEHSAAVAAVQAQIMANTRSPAQALADGMAAQHQQATEMRRAGDRLQAQAFAMAARERAQQEAERRRRDAEQARARADYTARQAVRDERTSVAAQPYIPQSPPADEQNASGSGATVTYGVPPSGTTTPPPRSGSSPSPGAQLRLATYYGFCSVEIPVRTGETAKLWVTNVGAVQALEDGPHSHAQSLYNVERSVEERFYTEIRSRYGYTDVGGGQPCQLTIERSAEAGHRQRRINEFLSGYSSNNPQVINVMWQPGMP